jgi:hypothetical protein
MMSTVCIENSLQNEKAWFGIRHHPLPPANLVRVMLIYIFSLRCQEISEDISNSKFDAEGKEVFVIPVRKAKPFFKENSQIKYYG